MSGWIEHKLKRLAEGSSPRVLDLFAGCGGLALGFQRAGCEILAGIEADPVRAATYGLNLHPANAELFSHAVDITQTGPIRFFQRLGLGEGRRLVDAIIGGPPCQAYARIGRAKLREVACHPKAYVRDERGKLYKRYLRFVEVLQPLIVLMENVPDILSIDGTNVAERIASKLESFGYRTRYTLLNTANYGVPQTRERWFLIGLHETIGQTPTFPAPTHQFDVPIGFRGTRSHAIRALNGDARCRCPHLSPLPDASQSPGRAVTCHDALSDLPSIPDDVKLTRQGRRNLCDAIPYRTVRPITEYQRLMRTWPGFETNGTVTAHVVRYLPRDYETFRRMAGGDDYPRALEVAKEVFKEKLHKLERQGDVIREGTKKWQLLWDSVVPPYDATKFPNKWRKLERDQPARTLMAHLSHDSYSHIHYADEEARTISVREAARLQSFPDGFQFCGAMNTAFGQVGNAVPPLLSYYLAKHILHEVRSSLATSNGGPECSRYY